jgi:arginine N-succinyltransferase
MIIIRPVAQKDLNFFTEFSFESIFGMTNFPRDREKMLNKIVHSENCFQKKIDHPEDEEYYFVLEDLTNGRIGGTCGILVQSNQSLTYFYKIEPLPINNQLIPSPKEIKILKSYPNPPTSSEVCSLYLLPTFRHSGQGRLVSLSRFLFMAAFPQRFKKKIIAEMRGYIDQRQVSPFWDSVGRHFCQLSFVELMALLDTTHEFIPEIIPEYPIYIPLLPKDAQEVIGKIHDSTKAAYQMLQQENFTFNQEIDLFEGGPILSAATSEIRSIKNSSLMEIELTKEPLLNEDNPFIISNERIDFRACYGGLKILSNQRAQIHEEVANALQVKQGDRVRYISSH